MAAPQGQNYGMNQGQYPPNYYPPQQPGYYQPPPQDQYAPHAYYQVGKNVEICLVLLHQWRLCCFLILLFPLVRVIESL